MLNKLALIRNLKCVPARLISIATAIVILAAALTPRADAADLTVDGLTLGQTSCHDAIHTVLINYRQTHAQAQLSEKEHDRQAKLMRVLLKKSQSDRSTLNELYAEYAAQIEKQEQARLSKWSPAVDTKGFDCALPGFAELGTSFATAFDLIQPGSMSLDNMRIKQCPYKRFFSATGVSADSSQSPLVCFDGKASFYAQPLRADYRKLKGELTKKYGAPQELASKMSLTSLTSANQNIQLNSLFKAANNYVLLVNVAENASGHHVLDATEVKAKDLRPATTSELYYFTRSLFEANQKNKLTYLSLERKQLELVEKKNMASDDKPFQVERLLKVKR